MTSSQTKISTTVRTSLKVKGIRLLFAIGGRLAPAGTVRRAAALFTRPFASSRSRARDAALAGATKQTLQIGGCDIATYAWGDPASEPYVLFAHGWSSHGTRVVPWVAPLRAAGYAVLAFDQRAHGNSSGSDTNLVAFTELLLEIGRRHGPAAAVIGHSLGGAATALALSRGLAAERAILIAPAADPVDAARRFARLIGMAEYLCARMVAGFERRVGISFEQLQAHRAAPQIGRPALIVHDLDDREVPWSEGERYARYWPQSRLISTRGLGHKRIVDDSSVIAAGLRFLHGEDVGERVVSSPNLPYGFA